MIVINMFYIELVLIAFVIVEYYIWRGERMMQLATTIKLTDEQVQSIVLEYLFEHTKEPLLKDSVRTILNKTIKYVEEHI